ncbi:phytanoyl-CoA dioxygenase family protein [Limnoglobus roseus]|uniref:Phytanoyl-CoA dioxygenase family protein n=1 Tax=Limnoglobus roseus TaxID=2598579 RepID=A0A5C1ABN6_9BACT|nr:phytanoyl-CoA dioxygenase family protein [Limnoglobus roseus]QEL14564.1 phytanoyl-CoA dioxygenase family protein [Limnoglobus roseus]
MSRTAWERDGFVIARGVFSPEEIQAAAADADRVEREFKHLVSTQNRRCRWQDNVFTGECQFDAFDPIIDLSPACAALARDPRLLSLLNDLYGEPAFLFKDKLIFKHPGAKGYALHQDWIAWGDTFPRSFLSLLVPLDPADEENGCTIVYPGYHHNGSLTAEDGNYHELPADTVDESRAVPLTLALGDVAVFGGFTPHRSNANLADRPRRQLYFSYTKESDGGDLRERHYKDFQEWLVRKYEEYGKTGTYFE